MILSHVVVGCYDGAGMQLRVPVRVFCTREQYEAGDHYKAAVNYCGDLGHSPSSFYADENDDIELIRMAGWNGTPVIDATLGEVIDEPTVELEPMGFLAQCWKASEKIAIDHVHGLPSAKPFYNTWYDGVIDSTITSGFRDWLFDQFSSREVVLP